MRYPCIPRRKRCTLVVPSIDPRSDLAYALSVPPGKYERKLKTQRNRRGFAQAVDHVVQFDDNRGTSPGLEMHMTFRGNSKLLTRTYAQVMHGPRQFVE